MLLISVVNAKDLEEIKIYGDEKYPPYSYLDEKGKISGVYTDIITEAAKNIKDYKIVLKTMPWRRGLNEIKRGKIIGLYPPYFRSIERPYMWPYSIPIVEEETIVVCNKKIKGNNLIWPKDFEGKKIGRNRGFATGGPKWEELVKKKKITDIELDSIDSAIKMLIKKRIDCYMNDRLSIFWTMNKMIKEKDLKEKDIKKITEAIIISRERGYIGFAEIWNPPYKKDFLKKFNHELHSMRKSGRIAAIIKKYGKSY